MSDKNNNALISSDTDDEIIILMDEIFSSGNDMQLAIKQSSNRISKAISEGIQHMRNE